MDNLESFFKAHEHTIAALEAVSTFLAVATSLILAILSQRASRTNITARASLSFVYHPTLSGLKYPTFFTVNILNRGIIPVSIPLSFFHWRLPLQEGAFLLTPLDYWATDQWVAQQRYAVEIQPRKSHVFWLQTEAQFREFAERELGASRWRRLRAPWIRAYVVSDDGRKFGVKLDNNMRKELLAASRKAAQIVQRNNPH